MTFLSLVRSRRSVRSFDGIALCHFALAMEEAGKTLALGTDDPGLPAEGMVYIASYQIN